MSLAETKTASSRRPRVGFLGVGWIGRHRMEGIIGADVVDIIAISDPSPEMAAEAQRLAPDAEVVPSLNALLDAKLDGIVIATPSAMHAAQSIMALEQGVSVFCQKPLGRTADEVRAVVDAARAADRLLGVDFSYRFTEGMRHIRELLNRGELGNVYAIDLTFHNAYGPDKPWFYDPAQSGGGCLMDLGVHLIDLALWSLGFPEVDDVSGSLFAEGQPLANLDQCEDYAVATLKLKTGTIIRLACSWRLQAGCDAIIGAEFFGTHGGAALRNVNGSFYDFVAERYRGTARETVVAPPDPWGARAASDWARRLSQGERFDAEAERLIDVAAVMDRIYRR